MSYSKDIDFWFYDIGVNVIPIPYMSKKPTVKWEIWQDQPIPSEVYESWKSSGDFNANCAIIMGKVWRGQYVGKYLACLDIDNAKGIKEFLSKLGKVDTLEKLAEKTIIEQHHDTKDKKVHIYFMVEKPLSKRSGIGWPNNKSEDIPALEVKSEGKHGVMCCTPSLHANGHPYQIIGTRIPLVLNENKSKILEDQIDQIYKTYSQNINHSNSNLTAELRLIATTRRIGPNPPKISKGSRSNTLISLVRVILNQHHRTMDIQDIRSFVEEVNQKLCHPPLSKEELDGIWEKDFDYLLKDLDSGKLGPRRNDGNENTEGNSRVKSKTELLTYKYTFKGQLYESVIIDERPFFLTTKDDEAILESFLEEETRILRPPALEEYPSYTPYTFKDIDEVKKYIDLIYSQDNTLDNLVKVISDQISKYIVHHKQILDYITALILFSYFQDKSPTVPYSMFVSDNGSGKSTIGNVFECFGYRCINMTDPTTANIFRIFGTVEPGQCTLVLDEAEKIDQEKDMMSILKTGYENGKKVQRINPLGKQEHFHTFGLKTMLAERSPNPFHAKGVLDRTFIISNYKGRPQLDIKETKISEKGKTEFSFYKNLLLIYRLMHFNDNIQDIDTGLEGREKELCKPLLQLFFNTKFLSKVVRVLETLLDEKNTRKANSLEREILEVVMDLIKEGHKDGIIPIPNLWDGIIRKTNSARNQFDDSNVISESHGTISKNSLLKMVRDRFGAKEKRYSSVRCLCFDYEKIVKNYEDYVKEEKPTKIDCKPINNYDANDTNDANMESLFNSFFQGGRSNPTVNEIQLGDKFPKANRQNGLDKNSEHSTPSKFSMGLENSVISVIPVIDTLRQNTTTREYGDEILPLNNTDKIYRKWKGGDIWGCNSCNDRGDKHYMLKHPCKNNKKM